MPNLPSVRLKDETDVIYLNKTLEAIKLLFGEQIVL
jgi:hypothetical protein